ncbi:MAG: O-antigen ligase family protein [Lachnospiraceae bacterium]|nr:O-antigen ligase family protein [Lachnospiraceae bacterium]
MERNDISSKKIMTGNALLISAIVLLATALWNEYSWYEKAAPLATLVSFVFLVGMFFCYVDIREAVADREFYIMAAGIAIAAVNIFLSGSGKGAWLTAADVLLAAYLAGRVRFSPKLMCFIYAYVGFYFYYWTFDVKGYFKGYNTNYGGLVLITGFVFAITGLVAFYERLKQTEKGGARFLFFFILFMFAWGYNIIAWYRARCAFLGLVVFAVLLLIPSRFWKNRVFYTFLSIAMTAGAIAISLLYVWLGRYTDSFGIRIFYKDIMSGRDVIWADLWNAFMRMPLTGIGSNYKINVDWMDGVFEVHNGLLDILIVHGVFVFAAVLILLVKRLLDLHKNVSEDRTARTAVSAVFAIFAASFMENFFIVPPFLLCTLALIAIAGSVCYNSSR